MIKVLVKDPNSEKTFTVEVNVDLENSDLSDETKQILQTETANLAKLYARALGYFKIKQIDEDGVVEDE
jgi:hypothetical protein